MAALTVRMSPPEIRFTNVTLAEDFLRLGFSDNQLSTVGYSLYSSLRKLERTGDISNAHLDKVVFAICPMCDRQSLITTAGNYLHMFHAMAEVMEIVPQQLADTSEEWLLHPGHGYGKDLLVLINPEDCFDINQLETLLTGIAVEIVATLEQGTQPRDLGRCVWEGVVYDVSSEMLSVSLTGSEIYTEAVWKALT